MSLVDFIPVTVDGVTLPQKCLYTRMINGFYVPCGRCEFCLKSRAREWAFRLEAESFDKYSYNVLLTYRDEELYFWNGKPSLNKVHIQLFLKRFRYMVDKEFSTKVRYFLAGEYGGKFHRPHYHMILFSEKKLSNKGPDPYSTINRILVNTWKHGLCDIEPLNNLGGSVYYLTSYMTAMSDGRVYERENKPFLMMSRTGLGKSWLKHHPQLVAKMIQEQDYTYRQNNGDNKFVVSLPRYLRRKIMPEEQQIARADAYYYYSQQQEEKLNNLSYEERNEHFRRLKQARANQKIRERDNYRRGKIHANNSNTLQLSRRVKTAEKQ